MANEERHVTMVAWPKEAATMTVRDTVPICIKLCEPICADSKYEIGITLFDRDVATIKIAGSTRYYNCQEKP